MDTALAALVRHRANGRYEYCRILQKFSRLRLQIEHIIPKQHRGSDAASNLALACLFCNSHKGPNLTGLDPVTGVVTRLFNPRDDRWEEHFRMSGDLIEGTSDVGRTTITVLAMNHAVQITLRRTMLAEEQANESGW
jgi:hypothetical protein